MSNMVNNNIYEKSFPVSWEELHRNSKALAWRLSEMKPYKGIIAVTRGGLVPAAIVARELDIRTVDTISIKSYDRHSRAEAKVLKFPDLELVGDGTGILIIDDLVDSGKTIEVVRAKMPKAHYATIYSKPMGRPQVDTYITEVSQDTWIFFPWDMALQYVEPYRGTD